MTLCVAAALAGVALGFIHIITGVKSPYDLPIDVVRRESFGYREMFVNAARIQALPFAAAKRKYPLGVAALQERGYIPSGHRFEARMMAEQRESVETWQAEFAEVLGRTQVPWQDQLQEHVSDAEMNPEDAQAYNHRGIALARQGEYAAALAEFSRAIRRDPTFADASYNRALVHIAIGNLGPAASDFGNVLTIRPEFVEVYLRRGRLYAAMNEHDKAIADFTRALDTDPRCAEALFGRSLAHYAKGNHEEARKDARKIQSLSLSVPSGFLQALRRGQESGRLRVSRPGNH